MKSPFSTKSPILEIIVYLVSLTELCGLPLASGGFPLVFPFLTTGWYYKPGPAESVVLGLLLVKVLALRLGSATGVIPIPYHLNDLFSRRIFKRSANVKNSTYYYKSSSNYTEIPLNHSLSDDEVAIIERILLGIRRIDSHDCFIRLLCQMNQDLLSGYGSDEDKNILQIFRIQPRREGNSSDTKSWSIWNAYSKALKPHKVNCSSEYSTCTLQESDLQYDSLLSGFF